MASVTDNEFGAIYLSDMVIARLAGIVANKSYGVVGMAVKNTKDGIVSLLNPSNLTKGVKVKSVDNKFSIDLHIIVQYGVNINAICESIMHNVKYQVENLAGIEVDNIDIYVESVRN